MSSKIKERLLIHFRLVLVLCFVFNAGYAQYTDTIYQYYDYHWNRVSEEEHFDYFRIAKRTSGNKWHVKDFYRDTKNLQMEGLFLDDSLTIQDGKTYYYYSNGNIQRECTYNKGKPVGLYREYAWNGTLTDSSRFKHTGMPFHKSFQWDDHGSIIAYAEYDMKGNGTGYRAGYFKDSVVSYFGKYTTGHLQDSTWTYYRADGSLAFTEVYDSGKVISWQCYDSAGQPQVDCDTASRLPTAAYNMKAYISKHLVFPENIKTGFRSGTFQTVLALLINEEGRIDHIYPAISSLKSIDEEAIRVARKLPKLLPARHKNRAVPSVISIPVKFKLN